MKKEFVLCMCLILMMCVMGCGERSKKELSEIKIIKDNIILSNNNEDSVPIHWDIESKILACKYGEVVMYNFKPNLETAKYIAGYYKNRRETYININDMEWYEYTKIGDIERKEDLFLISVFFVVDGVINKNFLSNEELNLNVKYFYEIDNIDKFQEIEIFDNNVIWAYSDTLEKTKEIYGVDYYPITCNDYEKALEILHPIIEKSGKYYIKIPLGAMDIDTERYIDYTITEFGEFYSYLSDKVEKIEDYYEDDGRYIRYFGLLEIEEIRKIIIE